MVNRPHIPRALKLCAINLYNRGLLDLDNILDCVGFSESTFYRALACWRATGDVVSPKSGLLVGRPRLLLHDDIEYLLCLVQHRPDYFLDELNDLLKDNRFISVHYSTIIRELGRCGISVKKLQRIALERCPDKCAAYIAHIGQYSPEQLGFIDETSKDDQTPAHRYGRSKKGQKAQKRQRFVRGKRLTATGLLTMDGMMASRVVQGSMDGEMFCSFLEEEVLPLCSPFPGKLSVLVLDNAKIHHRDEVKDLVASYGVRLIYLSPYSPDYNPIEEAFAKIKAFLRRESVYFLSSANTTGMIYDMSMAMTVITADDAAAYFRHAGYF